MQNKRHAILSASSSHRWLNCSPSVRLSDGQQDTVSDFALEGTDAHTLCEYKLRKALDLVVGEPPMSKLDWYSEEMEECANSYVAYVIALIEEVKKTCTDPIVLIEQRLDYSKYVEDGFGTGDCVIVADGIIHIIDYKHGQGVQVDANENPQMMLYALGALEMFGNLYDITEVKMTVYQPRRSNISTFEMKTKDLYEWEHAQVEFARRVELGRTYSSKSIFSSKLVCEDCGGFYGQKVWHSTSKYRRVVWQCNKKFKNKEDKCKTPTLTAEIIQMMFLNAYNTFMGGREQVIEDCEMIRKLLLDFTKIDVEIEKQTEEIEVIAERVKSLVKENASTPQSQDEYIKKYNNWSERYEVEYRKLENLQKDKELRISKDKAMEVFIENLKKQPLVVEVWDESLWPLMIEKAIVGRDGSIKFIFYNGTEIREEV